MYEQLEVATRLNDPVRMGNAYNNLAYVHNEKKEYAQAEAFLRKAHALATEDGGQTARVYGDVQPGQRT